MNPLMLADIALAGWNMFQQERSYQDQKSLNKQIMQREDSAIQRRTIDLKQAGYNPLMALGGVGATSAVLTAGKPPQVNSNFLEKQIAYQTAQKLKADIAATNAQTYKAMIDASVSKKQVDYMDSQIKNSQLDALLKSQDYDNFTNKEIRKWIQTISPAVTGAAGGWVAGKAGKVFQGKTRSQLNNRNIDSRRYLDLNTFD